MWKRGKLLVCEWLELVFDWDSFFLELLFLVGMGIKGGFGVGGINVIGIGLVLGKLCVINFNVGMWKGGFVDYVMIFKSLWVG